MSKNSIMNQKCDLFNKESKSYGSICSSFYVQTGADSEVKVDELSEHPTVQQIQRILSSLTRPDDLLPNPNQLRTHILIVVAGLMLLQLSLIPYYLSRVLHPT